MCIWYDYNSLLGMLSYVTNKEHIINKLKNYSSRTKDPLLKILSNIACMHIKRESIPGIEEELDAFITEAQILIERQDKVGLQKLCSAFINGAAAYG